MITTFTDFINESFQFEHDIEKEFNYLNKLLFNDEVPFPEISFDPHKTRVAWVTCKGTYTRSGWSDVYGIVLHFNKNITLTSEQFRNTLAHEMIHLLLYQRKIFRDYGGDHGVIFTREMDRINNMNVGVNISQRNDTITPFQQRQKKEKDFYVIFFNWKDEKILCPFSVKEECEKFWDIAMKSFKISSPKNMTIYMAKTSLNEINFYSVAKTTKNVKQYRIPVELYEKLIKESDILRKEQLNNLNESYSTTEKWYHFSDVDFIKMNPKPSHSDPAGIYMFPAYSIDNIMGYWKKKKYRFEITLKPNLNIIDLDTLTKEQELDIVKKLDTQDPEEFNLHFMKYFRGESEYYNFWQYIRNIHGYRKSFQSRDEFVKLGYDGIFSKDKIHSLEPQIIIFDPKNINIVKIEKRDDIFKPEPFIEKIKDDIVYETLRGQKEDVEDLKWNEEDSIKNDVPSYHIDVINKDKSFGIKIYYSGNDDGNIHANISPYKYKNYSMGSYINIYEPDWEEFGRQMVIDLLTAIEDIQ